MKFLVWNFTPYSHTIFYPPTPAQDVPYFPDSLDATHFSDTAFSSIPIPLPTRNLLFMAGNLTTFDP